MNKLEPKNRYLIKKDGVVSCEFSSLYDAIMCQLNEIKEITKKYYGAFGDSPMPLTFEACLIFDEKIENNNEYQTKAHKVLGLFRAVVNSETYENFFDSVNQNLDKPLSFEIDELKISVTKAKDLILAELENGIDYVKTNIFSSLEYKGNRYFRFSSSNDNIRNNPTIKFGKVFECSIDLELC